MRLRIGSPHVLSFALALLPAVALAEPRDPAAAQALFDEALSLMKKGRHADACPKLTESQRLDPGVGTQFHLADCLEKVGRTASAWALFLEVESVAKASGQSDRERVAGARAKRLEPRLPRLRIEVPQGRNVPGLEVVRDGMAVGAAQWGTPIPVDPGPHEIVSNAPGRRSVSMSVEAREGETATFEVPALDGAASEPVPATEGAPVESEREPSSDRPLGIILGLGAAGVIGVGVGATFGLMASSEYEKSNDSNLCSVHGVEVRNAAIRKGNVATIAFAVGGAALAGAGVLYLVTGGPSAAKEGHGVSGGVAVAPGFALLSVEGKF
jgi:hypothetical protein